MQVLLDDQLVREIKPTEVKGVLAQLESELGNDSRLVSEIKVGESTFWSVEDVDVTACQNANAVYVSSCTLDEYVSEASRTAVAYARELREELKRLTGLWQLGWMGQQPTWTQALEGLEWLTSVGTRVAHIKDDRDWALRMAKFSEVLESVESVMASGVRSQVILLVRHELAPAVRMMERWFRVYARMDETAG